MLTQREKVNYLARMQAYRDMLRAIEHTNLLPDIIARMLVHIEVIEDNFEETIVGGDAPVPSDLFRLTHWFEHALKPLTELSKAND